MEKKWSESQKQLYKKKLFDDIQKSRSASYIDVLYKRAEENGGRIRNIDQLITVLENTSNEKKHMKILRTEIALQKRLHNADYLARPYLYHVNRISVEDMTKNLTTLLTTDEVSGSEPVSFPDNEEVLKILSCEEATTSTIGNIHSSDANEITIN